jgi:acetyltransferase-like isoleucine patch superfamily enzyme
MQRPSAARRDALRSAADSLGVILLLPAFAAYRGGLVGFTAVSQGLSIIPGQAGRVLRRAWYSRTLAACGRNLVVDFGAAIRTPRTRVGDDCYIGVYNWLGFVDLGDDFMSGSHVTILSGRRQHGFARLDVPMREQGGALTCVAIGRDVWVGAGVTISSDVAPHSIVASGSVVTKTFPPYSILGGVPASAIGDRRDGSPGPGPDAGEPPARSGG